MKKNAIVSASARKALSAAFREFRKNGYLARENFACCATCAWTELSCEAADMQRNGQDVHGIIYYHGQDADGIEEFGECNIGFGGVHGKSDDEVAADDAAVGRTLVETLRKHGLSVEWNGSPAVRVLVDMKEATAGT